MANFICKHSRMNEKQYNKVLLNRKGMVGDVGTVLVGQEAVDSGLIDEIGTIGEAVAALRTMVGPRAAAGD